MKVYLRDKRPWVIAGAIVSLMVAFSACQSTRKATGKVSLQVSESPKPTAPEMEEDYLSAKDVIVDSKAVVRKEKRKPRSPVKKTRSPWRFADDWWNRIDE